MADLHIKLINLGYRLFPGWMSRLTNHLIFRRLIFDLAYFKSLGFDLDVIYDVGARHGNWSKYFSKWFPGVHFILFEANKDCEAYLEKTKFQYYMVPLHSEIGENIFYTVNGTGDSFYREQSSIYSDAEQRSVLTNTLDRVVDLVGIPLPNFIKLDTQGSEIEILRGGQSVLLNADFIYVEISIVVTNHGAPLIADYVEFLGRAGFFPYGVYEFHSSRGCLCQIDMLFISDRVRKKLIGLER